MSHTAAGEPRPLAESQREVGVNWICAGVVGVLLGLATGVGAYQLPVPPFVQSVAAVFAAVLLNSFVMWFIGLRYPILFGDAGGGYFAFGVENLRYLGVLVAVGAVLHMALGVLGTAIPWASEYRPMILGGAAGLFSAIEVARGIHSLSRLT